MSNRFSRRDFVKAGTVASILAGTQATLGQAPAVIAPGEA